jgi:hypothetical protein
MLRISALLLAAGVAVGIGLVSFSASSYAREFCYNKYTGRFQHWGACEHHPRVYCYSRYTGRFLHWGAC